MAEDDLVDAYIGRELSENDVLAFEQSLQSSPRLVRRVGFARAFAKSISHNTTAIAGAATDGRGLAKLNRFLGVVGSRHVSLRLNLAICSLVLMVGGALIGLGWLRLRLKSQRLDLARQELDQRSDNLGKEMQKNQTELEAQLKEQREVNASLTEQLQLAQKQSGEGSSQNRSFVSLFLLPGGLRGAGSGQTLFVAPEVLNIRLSAFLKSDDYSSYKANVKTVEGNEIWSAGNLRSRSTKKGKVLELQIPAAKVPPGVYVLEVSGLSKSNGNEVIGDYSFQVRAKTR